MVALAGFDEDPDTFRARFQVLEDEYAGKKVLIDCAAYRDYFPELKVGIKDDKTGKFFETRADDVFKAVISEFHDMFTRRTFDEMQRIGTIPPGQNLKALEFGANFDSRGFRNKTLGDLEIVLDQDKETAGLCACPTDPRPRADCRQ